MASKETTDANQFEIFSNSKSAIDKMLLQPYNHIDQTFGEQVEYDLYEAFNHWLDVPLDKYNEIREIYQMLQNALYLTDDIEDNSKLRKGVPTAHIIFGIPSTINTSNYVYFLVQEKILQLGHPEAITIFTEQLLEFHRGQGLDIYMRDNFICPTEEDYKKIVNGKTIAFYKTIFKLMQLFSNNKSDFTALLTNMGRYIQLINDYENFHSEECLKYKNYCEDLTEGKFSFPIIHSIRSNQGDQRIMNILRLRTTDVAIKRYAVDLMEKNGSFEYTKKVFEELDAQIREEIDRFGGNPYLIAFLDERKMKYCN